MAFPPSPTDDAPITEAELPCDRTYFSPSLLPSPKDPFIPACLDRGYFHGVADDVFTRETIARKVDEMRARPDMPLLLENQPLSLTFRPLEVDMNRLHALEMALFLPPMRNPPMTFDPIINYIQTHYTPGPLVVRNRLQIWYPNSTSSRTASTHSAQPSN